MKNKSQLGKWVKAIKAHMAEKQVNNISINVNRTDAELEQLRPYFKTVMREPFGYVRFEV